MVSTFLIASFFFGCIFFFYFINTLVIVFIYEKSDDLEREIRI